MQKYSNEICRPPKDFNELRNILWIPLSDIRTSDGALLKRPTLTWFRTIKANAHSFHFLHTYNINLPTFSGKSILEYGSVRTIRLPLLCGIGLQSLALSTNERRMRILLLLLWWTAQAWHYLTCLLQSFSSSERTFLLRLSASSHDWVWADNQRCTLPLLNMCVCVCGITLQFLWGDWCLEQRFYVQRQLWMQRNWVYIVLCFIIFFLVHLCPKIHVYCLSFSFPFQLQYRIAQAVLLFDFVISMCFNLCAASFAQKNLLFTWINDYQFTRSDSVINCIKARYTKQNIGATDQQHEGTLHFKCEKHLVNDNTQTFFNSYLTRK